MAGGANEESTGGRGDPLARAAELDRANESLRQEAGRLREDSDAIKSRILALQKNPLADRRFRLAALNLLEDLQEARRRQEHAAAERRRAEDSLRLNEERTRLIVENAREYAIFSLDLDRRVTSWNPGAEKIFGFREAEIIGQSADVIFTEEDRAAGAPLDEARAALATGKAMDERWHARKDGSRFWSSGAMMAMRGPDRRTVGFVKILRDQTEAKELQETLAASRAHLQRALHETERARQDAEAANRAKDQFLAALSHELRTPLTPVLMAAESLLRGQDLSPRVRDALEMIARNIQLETSFIDDLLDVTRISHGKFELIRNPVDIHEALRRAIEITQADFSEKQQKLTISLEARRTQGSGDFARLQQVFWNLLKNAAKFTPPRGEIRVISRDGPVGWVVVDVADNGRGIDPSAVEHIFEAFRQEDATIGRKFGGLGLGLAIAKATVVGHGGRISATSAGLGKGATFTVRLPVQTIT